jgi:hypothetical protein
VSDPQPYEHYRPAGEADVDDGVYRVVGAGDPVVLLEVADADGDRVTTGRTVAVPRADLDAFEPAENPDAGFRPGQIIDGLVEELRMVVDRFR